MTNQDRITLRTRYHSILAQSRELRSPSRRNGPSIHEAEESARAMENEAEEIARILYWTGTNEARKACGMDELDVAPLISRATERIGESVCACSESVGG